RRIMEFMRQIMPSLDHVSIKQVSGYVVPQFLVKDSPKEKSHFFDPVQLSDGTLRMFGMLLALYQIPPPRFLAMEEPEQTIHPGVLELLVEAFREVSKRTQLLLTTHSPYMLDNFDPAEIRVVSMEGGETRLSTIRKSQVATVKQGLMSISEIMALDGLRPELKM
ncbi:MAG: AAA family ATPase, partial [Pseudomonadota bacterium]